MSTETADPRADHIRSVTITMAAALMGVAAAVASALLTPEAAGEAATDRTGQLAVVGAIAVQIVAYEVIDFEEFGGGKDYLFIAFMTFSLWFVTWGIILTTGATF